ncbi:phospholipid-transporting ATPase FetA-like [Myotis daubentonii]|uniref:phospholipid-transporting ATPase FetA-like n=1 Tax=Myotis daubentonii TaxID=98922 RepID=UPI00287350DD|nr:phospholipid-transporting ATPase FetA-like [Myotis daubentonii]
MRYIKLYISEGSERNILPEDLRQTEILSNYSWYYFAMSVYESRSEERQTGGEQERYVQANNEEFNSMFGYPNNTIKTSKYNIFNFLPLNLFEQFQRLANAYFLILLILQLIPQISSLAWYTTVIPLIVVLSITAAKDAIDDLKRHQNDNQVNNRSVLVLMNGRMEKKKWMNIQVGDIIKLENNQPVTADILLLSSSEPYSMTYIETAELDGETNLKVKQAIQVTSEMENDLNQLSAFNGEVRCDAPNNKLGRFTGVLTYKGKNYLLDLDKLLLRGCTIRNTDWCYGLVIYTGPDTKLMQNSGKSSFKRTHIDHLMNVLVLWIFLFLGCMCFILAIGHSIWESRRGYYFQDVLPWKDYVSSSFVSAILIFWSYFIILNTMVPISLYVSVEIIRLGNSFYINCDQKMFYAPKNTPAQACTTTLNEELGQVKYVFSDKTGTLTRNIMVFNKCSIHGTLYGAVYDRFGQRVEISEKTEKVSFSYNELADPKFSFYDKTLVDAVKRGEPWVHLFFRSLALCHTVMAEEKVEGELVYQAQSPDEGALVTAARNFGFVLRSRSPETITVVEMGKTIIYRLLAILDFSNVRKRMSVIVKTPEDRIMLFCKGADTILCQLLLPSCTPLRDVTMEHLDEFASEGLRTLMVAYRELDKSFFRAWFRKHSEICFSLEDRESKISSIYEEVEKDLMLLGATAIEDKLQDEVPQTIKTLNKAKIKIWVLTGDKQETAVNIAYASNLFEDDMDGLLFVEGKDDETVEKELRSALYKMKPESLLDSDPINSYLATKPKMPFKIPEEEPSGNYGLVIHGYSLACALEGNLELELLRAACMCKAVICCRMTPLQKAQVVELVKKYKKVVTLAIGDGANDVSMIKAAHIGVGISGQEGMQAVLNSDFTFCQFHYLQRLLLVHGRWSYNRMCKFLSYFFYKNFTFTLLHFWYSFYNGFSAQTVYDTWFITFYNLVYTCLPVLGLSLFDQDVNETWSLRFPELYEPGQLNLYFNKKEFLKCLVHGIYSSCVLFFIPMGTIFNSVRSDGKEISDYQSFSLIVQTSLLWVVTMQIALETTYWTMINHLFTWGSLGFYFCILLFLYSDDGLCVILPNIFQFLGVAKNTLTVPQLWLSIVLSVVLCVLPALGYQFLKPLLWPLSVDKVFDTIHGLRHPLTYPVRSKLKMTGSRRSAYAFSHKQGFGPLITSGMFMKSKWPRKNITHKK